MAQRGAGVVRRLLDPTRLDILSDIRQAIHQIADSHSELVEPFDTFLNKCGFTSKLVGPDPGACHGGRRSKASTGQRNHHTIRSSPP